MLLKGCNPGRVANLIAILGLASVALYLFYPLSELGTSPSVTLSPEDGLATQPESWPELPSDLHEGIDPTHPPPEIPTPDPRPPRPQHPQPTSPEPEAPALTELETVSADPQESATPPEALDLAPTTQSSALSLSEEYSATSGSTEACKKHFSTQYLTDLRDHAISYCGSGSRSQITCFHSHAREDGEVDSFCYVRGATFDAEMKKFTLGCHIRQPTDEERAGGLIAFKDIREYWYQTGIPTVFRKAIKIESADELTPREDLEPEGGDGISTQIALNPPKNYLLLKREGETNPWHCYSELFSAFLSFDVLSISSDEASEGKPFFNTGFDPEDTQVVITDDRGDGPFFDLWTLFARRPIIRLKDLVKDPVATAAIQDANLIIPLAGGSSLMWAMEEPALPCKTSELMSVFSQRLIDFYEVPDPPMRTGDEPILVTFIDRTTHRRLINQTELFEDVRKRHPLVEIQLIDFAAIPLPEQLKIVRETDILVGIHGAGLTHAMFMREHVGAVVEIQPDDMGFLGFRMITEMRGLNHFRMHGLPVPQEEEAEEPEEVEDAPLASDALQKRREWHWTDVEVDPEKFLQLMDVAIRSMYSRGQWDTDTV